MRSGRVNGVLVGAALIALALSSFVSSGPRVAWALQAVLANDVFSTQHFTTFVGDNTVRSVNPTTKVVGAGNTDPTAGMLCEMIYVFDPHEELAECCGCPVTNDGLRQIGVIGSLTANPLGGPVPHNGVIKIVVTDPNVACPQGTGPGQKCPNPPPFFPCDASLHADSIPATGFCGPGTTHLDPTMRHWILHTDQVFINAALNKGITEEEFQDSPLDANELCALETNCDFIHRQGSGHGVCDCGVGDTLAARPAAGQQ